MPAHLRVLGKLESKLENTLEGIDAILGCPLLFPSLDGMYLSYSEYISFYVIDFGNQPLP